MRAIAQEAWKLTPPSKAWTPAGRSQKYPHRIQSTDALRMTNPPDPSPLSDVCLLLRAHAEHSWLNHEVLPVVHELEQRDTLPEEQLGAAMAYLEVLWIEASQRAAETEAARAELDAIDAAEERTLSGKARGYHAAVGRLRSHLARIVDELLAVPCEQGTRYLANN
jgi:uncharacterized protein YqcC (DUF446 family)